MFIAPFLGDMVGDELNNKNFDFGNSDEQMTRNSMVMTHCRHALRGAKTTPLSLKGWRFGTPAHPPDTQMTRLTRAIFGVPKIKLKSIASVASANKDEMYIPDDKGAPF